MNSPLNRLLSSLTLGETQQFENVTVTPLFFEAPPHITYFTLSQALATGRFTIGEVSQGGSVPDLRVVNELDAAVLLLDGEELRGAKQNRVTNATMLVDAHGRLIIPVSCTEQGRWSYNSDRFQDSNVVMMARHRAAKSADVKRSLEQERGHRSDQQAVWERVQDLNASLAVHSPTGAMRDAYEQHRNHLDHFTDAFPHLDGQRGLAVSVNGKLVGIEVLSRPEAYASVHPKLVQSYAIDSLTRRHADVQEFSVDYVAAFVERLLHAQESRHTSVGRGLDYRYEGSDGAGAAIVGSALLVDDEPVHAAFFRIAADGQDDGGIVGFRQRSGYRSGGGSAA